MVSFAVFSVLQVPTALGPNAETPIAARTVSGFVGSECATYLLPRSYALVFIPLWLSRMDDEISIWRRDYAMMYQS